MSIQNCCSGKLAELFDKGAREITSDIAERPTEERARKMTLTIAFTPSRETGQMSIDVSSNIKLPELKRSGTARIGPITGILENMDFGVTGELFNVNGTPKDFKKIETGNEDKE